MSSLGFIDELEKTHEISLYKLEKIIADSQNCEYLFAAADRVRRRFSKSYVHLKALIEISNICVNTCFYCGLRGENRTLKRYKMRVEDIIECAKEALNSGYKTIVLQSGESGALRDEQICEAIREISLAGARITLSLGEKSFAQYEAYKNAGANRYLLRIETTNRALYKTLHPKMSLQNRLKCLKNLQILGYETGSGLLVGLPGCSDKILVRDLMFLKKNDFDMVGIGPFIPAPNTPLAKAKGAPVSLALKMVALTRLLLPNINIPATTAIETLDPDYGRKLALKSGANVIMPSITRARFHELYSLYPGKFKIEASAGEIYEKFSRMLPAIGDRISPTNGDSERFNQR